MTEGLDIVQYSVSDVVGIQQPQNVRSDTFCLVRVQAGERPCETFIERGAWAGGSAGKTNRHRPSSLHGVQPAGWSAPLLPIRKLLKEVV